MRDKRNLSAKRGRAQEFGGGRPRFPHDCYCGEPEWVFLRKRQGGLVAGTSSPLIFLADFAANARMSQRAAEVSFVWVNFENSNARLAGPMPAGEILSSGKAEDPRRGFQHRISNEGGLRF